ncbi:MAG: L-threonylcarbamoyladenylate synthase [Paludibacteraceae bacterium]|nr:L-threonylcarbamoyladenylate synthase [Paludibacteraceae bacterium]
MLGRYDKSDLEEAVRVLRMGGVIVYPTDTVWGIGCDATNEEAVRKVYALKRREDSKSMLVLLDAPGKLQGYVEEVPEMAWELLECTMEEQTLNSQLSTLNSQRPLTIIYPGAKNLAKNLIAEDGSVGIRITQEPFSKALCERLRRPVVSTSANISGEPAAKTFRQISEEVLRQADYVCQFRRDDEEEKQPSSIIKLGLHNEIQIIRP